MNIRAIRKQIDKYILNFRYAFRPHKPLLLSRLMFTYLKILFFNAKPLRYVDFAIDFRCNMNCQHCFAVALAKDENRITPDQYKKTAREAMELGAVNFSFQGGEPLLYEDLSQYIKAASPERNLISVTTNGILLNEEKIKELKSWGVDILTVSLDSGIAKEHDDFRRTEGAFLKVLNGIKIALKNNLNVTIGTVVSHNNLRSEGLKKLIGLAGDLKVILMLVLAVPVGRWKDKDDIMLTKQDMEYINELVLNSAYVRTDFDANYLYRGCGAVKEILYITPYGDVLACPFIHISLGNIKEETINTIRKRALKNIFFGEYHNYCLAGEDGQFMRDVMSNMRGFEKFPVPYSEIFGCR